MIDLQYDAARDDYFVPRYSWQPPGESPAKTLCDTGRIRGFYDRLTTPQKLALPYCWKFWARPKQRPPPPSAVSHPLGWKFWAIFAGRAMGKTRLAAEMVRAEIEAGRAKRIALGAPTYRDVVQTMIRGESGLLSVFPANGLILPRFVRTDNIIYFENQETGRSIAEAHIYTGEEPERLRGPQHDFGWFDEVAAMKYLEAVWLLFVAGHRLGRNPRAVFTTTPKVSLLKINLLQNDRTVVTFGTTRENAHNLAPGTYETLAGIYSDTDFEAQELGGKLRLDDTGAIFKATWLNKHRVEKAKKKGAAWVVSTKEAGEVPLIKIVVAIDPSGSSKDSACECGIVVLGLGADNNAYVIEDLSKRATPDEWANIAVDAARRYEAGIVYEANFGDELVGTLVRRVHREKPGATGPLKVIDLEAQASKVQRAMVASPFVQKGRVRMAGFFKRLEDQMTQWTPGDASSPDRMDAFVWAVIHFLVKQPARGSAGSTLLPF